MDPKLSKVGYLDLIEEARRRFEALLSDPYAVGDDIYHVALDALAIQRIHILEDSLYCPWEDYR